MLGAPKPPGLFDTHLVCVNIQHELINHFSMISWPCSCINHLESKPHPGNPTVSFICSRHIHIVRKNPTIFQVKPTTFAVDTFIFPSASALHPAQLLTAPVVHAGGTHEGQVDTQAAMTTCDGSR